MTQRYIETDKKVVIKSFSITPELWYKLLEYKKNLNSKSYMYQ